MKRITLNYKTLPNQEPSTYTVTYENGDDLIVQQKISKRLSAISMSLTRQPDGTFKNEHGVEFVQAKADRRPKPFQLRSQEEGRGPWHVRKFATLEELQAAAKKTWEGWDYVDGDDGFHNDYCLFLLVGATTKEVFGDRPVEAY